MKYRLGILAVSAAIAAACASPGTATPPTQPHGVTTETVVRISDGDTLEVATGTYTHTVRLIGVDTPETKKPGAPVQCFGPEATAHTYNLAPVGTLVHLERDDSQQQRDRYSRDLAYVWLTSGQMLNYQLIIDGYGREYTFGHRHYRYQSQFYDAEKIARDDQRGLWRTCH